jgi:hypothetical protein
MSKNIYQLKNLSKELNLISSSEWKYYENFAEYGKTHLLQNKKTKEYFLFDQFSVQYNQNEEIELENFQTKLDDKSLKIIFRNLEGIISEEEFREYEDLKIKMENVLH